MAYQLWSQDNFTKGELTPYLYARAQVEQYYNGLKQAQNVLTYPTGAAGKRFGTLFQAILTGFTAFNQLFFATFQYLDQCVYQLVFTPLNIAIYLEGILIANVTTTLDAVSVYNLSSTVIDATFRVAGQGFKPFDLVRSNNAANIIVSAGADFFGITTALTTGQVLPVIFTTAGSLPVTVPQIKLGVTYFIFVVDPTHVRVYSTAFDAKFDIGRYLTTTIGTGTANLIVENTWTFAHTVFKNVPVFDFDDGYDLILFTPAATTGSYISLNSSVAIFTPAFIGGAFIGGGGTARIVNYGSPTNVAISIQVPFDAITPIDGSLSLLAEPAWSDARGWPEKCSSYQNRALFANSDSLPNGFWASVVNEYPNFTDLTGDDDDGISWYPTSNEVNVIRFIVPFRSITVHTNSGIYSSPLSEIAAITPSTFTLQLQDSTPADVLQPQAIDNQIIVLAGNDVHTMLWDGINNAYTSNIVSITSEQLIKDPVDETSFADLRRAGSRYVFIINANGTMAVYQTLQGESVSGFTPAIMEQSYGSAQFLQAASSFNGRCWFVVQRQIATAQTPITISGFTPFVPGPPIVLSTLQATASNFDLTLPTAITFTTTGSLPTSSPQITVQTFFWAIGIDANHFQVYLSQADAIAKVNAVAFTNAGTNSHVVPFPLRTIFTLEELSQDAKLDCAVAYVGTPTDTVTTGTLFNAQAVKMVGDGFGFDAIGVNNQVVFESHGSTVNVSDALIGFPINLIIEPMPLAPPPGQQTTLTKPKHIRTARFMFNNTIGGTINGVPIALNPFSQANIGDPPFPARGFVELSIMKGWDDFNFPSFTIEHSDPFNIELIGVFYSIDI